MARAQTPSQYIKIGDAPSSVQQLCIMIILEHRKAYAAVRCLPSPINPQLWSSVPCRWSACPLAPL